MKKLFKLSPEMKEELRDKGVMLLIIEAIACFSFFGVVFGALFLLTKIQGM